MRVAALLADLRRRDVHVKAEGDRVRCTAPPGVLTPELREALQRHKAEILEFLRAAETLAHQQRAIVPLERRGAKTPIFAVGGHNGDVFCYRPLARHLGGEHPFFGLEPPGVDGQSKPLTRIEDLAEYFADQIRAFQPDGPCILAGYCAGGTVAFELGRQLLQRGATINFVALFGSPYPTWYRHPATLRRRLAQQRDRIGAHARALWSLTAVELRRYVAEKLQARKVRRASERAAAVDPVLLRRAQVERATTAALRRYRPGPFAGRVSLFLPSKDWPPAAPALWRALTQRADEYVGPEGCDADTMLLEPHAVGLAELFRRCRDARDGGSAGRPAASTSDDQARPLLVTSLTR